MAWPPSCWWVGGGTRKCESGGTCTPRRARGGRVQRWARAGGRELTVAIDDGTLDVRWGLHGEPDLRVEADAATWLDFLAKDVGLLKALVTRRLRIRGPSTLMRAFAACFP